MKLVIIPLLAVFLSGCLATVPVARKFPDIPPVLENSCEPLKQVPETDKLSETLVTVTENYSLYYQCSLLVDTWQDWYRQQREIFDGVR